MLFIGETPGERKSLSYRNLKGISSWLSVVLDMSVEIYLIIYPSGKFTEMKGTRKSHKAWIGILTTQRNGIKILVHCNITT